MKVAVALDMAREGELKQLSIKDDIPAIMAHLNLGLIELYKRFDLKTDEVIVDLIEGQTDYTLDSAEAYIRPTFNDDLMAVTAAYDDQNNEYTLNDENDDLYSIMTPTWNTIQVANPIAGLSIALIYRAAPIYLVVPDQATADTTTLPLPPQLLEALLHYIGYRGHGSMDGSLQTENNSHYQRFEASCDRVKALGLIASNVVPKGINKHEEIG